MEFTVISNDVKDLVMNGMAYMLINILLKMYPNLECDDSFIEFINKVVPDAFIDFCETENIVEVMGE